MQVDYLHWNNNLARSELGESQVASSLMLVDVKRGAPFASVVDRKGQFPYVEKAFAQGLDTLGADRIIIQCDSEPSLIAVCREVAEERLTSKTRVRWTPRQSSASNGAVEVFNGIIAGRTRTILSAASRALDIEIRMGHPLLLWAV